MRQIPAIYFPEGEAIPEKCIGVDGMRTGCAVHYSHWVGANSPSEIAHDLSTGIVLNAIADYERWVASYNYVTNDHVDTDGLLSVALIAQPKYAEYKDVLLAAAYYGDFSTLAPGNNNASLLGVRLALRLNQLIRTERLIGDTEKTWQQRCFDAVVFTLPKLIAESQEVDSERDEHLKLLAKAREQLTQQQIRIETHDNFSVIYSTYQFGHVNDGPETLLKHDDCPVWVLAEKIPSEHHQLICLHKSSDNSYVYQLDAPRHSWAVTVDLPKVPWREWDVAAIELQRLEEQHGADRKAKWYSRPAASERGFVCQLFYGTEDGEYGFSLLDPLVVIEVLKGYFVFTP